MKKDAIQQTLEVMELINPSRSSYSKGFLNRVKDKVYFLRRFLSGDVEEYNGFGYNPKSIWYDRLNVIEKLAVEGELKEFSYLVIKDLSKIMIKDDDWRARELCAEMLKSFSEHRNFSDTYPYRERIAEEERIGIKLSSGLSYNLKSVWYDRLNVLENVTAIEHNKITEGLLQDLKLIAKKDDDWRIRELAENMIDSYELHGDFSETEPYKRRIAEEERTKIKVAPELGYDSNAVWHKRLNAVEKLAKSGIDTKKFKKDLEIIATKDDDWRVREVVDNLLDNCFKANCVVTC